MADTETTVFFKLLVLYGREWRIWSRIDDAEFAAFLSNIELAGVDECWRWKGSRRQTGEKYGSFYYRGHTVPAHRFSYIAAHGPIGPDIHLHRVKEDPVRCIGAECVNERHLRPLTPEDHLAVHGRRFGVPLRRTKCSKGHELVPYTDPDGFTSKRCTVCRAEYSREKKAEFREGHPTRQTLNICRRGHPFTEESTYVLPGGGRTCKICRDERYPKWAAKNQAYLEKFNAARRAGPSRAEIREQRADCCKNGHPWTEENTTYVNGEKRCRECGREAAKHFYHRHKVLKGHHKTHCPQGHEMSGDNLYVDVKTGNHACKACAKANKQRRREQIKARGAGA